MTLEHAQRLTHRGARYIVRIGEHPLARQARSELVLARDDGRKNLVRQLPRRAGHRRADLLVGIPRRRNRLVHAGSGPLATTSDDKL